MSPGKNGMILNQGKEEGTPRKGKMVKITIDDSSLTIPFLSYVCGRCRHFLPKKTSIEVKRCHAFDKIPMKIWCGENDHTQPYPGDKGIRFELYELKKEG